MTSPKNKASVSIEYLDLTILDSDGNQLFTASNREEAKMSKQRRLEGVYMLLDKGEVVYVGQSNDLMKRIGDHLREGTKTFDSFYVYETSDRKRMEGYLQKTLKPKYNVTDNSWYGFGMPEEQYTECMTLKDICDSYSDKAISVKLVAGDLDDFYISEHDVLEAIHRHGDEIPAWRHYSGIPSDYVCTWEIDWKWYHENKEKLKDWILHEN